MGFCGLNRLVFLIFLVCFPSLGKDDCGPLARAFYFFFPNDAHRALKVMGSAAKQQELLARWQSQQNLTLGASAQEGRLDGLYKILADANDKEVALTTLQRIGEMNFERKHLLSEDRFEDLLHFVRYRGLICHFEIVDYAKIMTLLADVPLSATQSGEARKYIIGALLYQNRHSVVPDYAHSEEPYYVDDIVFLLEKFGEHVTPHEFSVIVEQVDLLDDGTERERLMAGIKKMKIRSQWSRFVDIADKASAKWQSRD